MNYKSLSYRTFAHISAILAAALCLFACEKYDWPGTIVGSSPSINKRFAGVEEYNRAHPIADITVGAENYSLTVITDIHADQNSPNLEAFIQKSLKAKGVEPILLCLGDLTYGKGNHPHINDVFAPLRSASWQLFFTPGNHDLYFGDWESYASFWPASAFTFKIKTPSGATDLFIALDSSEGTLGTDQRRWIETVLSHTADSLYRNVTVMTHTHFFKKDSSQGTTGNYTLEETADLLDLFARGGVDFVLTGHDHFYERTVWRGVTYYTLNGFCESETQHSWYTATFSDAPMQLSESRL